MNWRLLAGLAGSMLLILTSVPAAVAADPPELSKVPQSVTDKRLDDPGHGHRRRQADGARGLAAWRRRASDRS